MPWPCACACLQWVRKRLSVSVSTYRVLLMGLSGSGKTQLLHRWKLDKWVPVSPTLSFNVETVNVPWHSLWLWSWQRRRLCIWDTGGNDRDSRPTWRHYMANVDAVVVVVDSANVDRLGDAQDACDNWQPMPTERPHTAASLFLHVLVQEDLASVPILVLAHKQDVENSLSAAQVRAQLGVDMHEGLLAERSFRVLASSAWTGEGRREAIGWLSSAIQRTRLRNADLRAQRLPAVSPTSRV
mmetsp:Transcript_31911/g.68640  ORF Transcript_31911/g.68640 Transcript_31911/m.68640 type:complete len:241 (-) Transcript_31911:279-1001(-)